MHTIAAISTPQAVGGLGMVRISGDLAVEIADKVFVAKNKKKISSLKGYTAAYGKIIDGEKELDEAVALVFKAPKSYTGEDVVELTCHGGLFVVQRVLRTVLKAGAIPAEAGEFTKRAFLNGKMDLAKAESVMNIISAQGETALSAAMTVLEGSLSKKIEATRSELVKVAAGLAAFADYPDEEIKEISHDELLKTLNNSKNTLSQLLLQFDFGRAIIEGVDTVICGRPNVGKSTLMNFLSGVERSIVTPVPGTTRDIIEETVRIGDIVLHIADTAGIRVTDDEVESIGVQRAKQRMDRAGLILAVFDSSQELSHEDMLLLNEIKGKRAIALINKSDLGKSRLEVDKIKEAIPNIAEISAATGEGMEKFYAMLTDLLGTTQIDTSVPMLTTERQRQSCERANECIVEAYEALNSGITLDAINVSIDCAIDALFELTGEKATQAVVNEVFNSFCVGK